MRVSVEEPRQNGLLGQVDYDRARRDFYICTDGFDILPFNQNYLIDGGRSGFRVNQLSGSNGSYLSARDDHREHEERNSHLKTEIFSSFHLFSRYEVI